ncbi:hypothetical protein FB567DRAFT_276287 [Paraphoma chrysanthemicola]|uniref:Uncharacterized protein n=1 Tax=Paraphoma chrysanthemicola TaxID=798071 RepID=A0A8K0W2R5_9PLEO|nr:hypothetical protein FB567DRAFT_276287 [Paraphoma chrysanthemicola]
MSRKENARKHSAQRKREALCKTHLRIGGHLQPRTLKASTRKQIERSRTPRLWIPTTPSRMLSLPVEIRQQILYESCTTVGLLRDVEALSKGALPYGFWNSRAEMSKTGKERKCDLFRRSSQETQLSIVLSRAVLRLGLVCKLIYQDMPYVVKRWQQDLNKYLDEQRDVQQRGIRFVVPIILGLHTPGQKPRKGEVVEAVERAWSGRRRSSKCWYCMERHPMNDPVCPMERRDPETWYKLTKPVGGWRGKPPKRSTFKGKKEVFEG